jgi:hypothetical protein
MSDDNRTVAEVLRQRQNATVGCCDRFASNQGCVCLERAKIRESQVTVNGIPVPHASGTRWPGPTSPSFDADREAIITDLRRQLVEKDAMILSLSERTEAQKQILERRAEATDKDRIIEHLLGALVAATQPKRSGNEVAERVAKTKDLLAKMTMSVKPGAEQPASPAPKE